MCVKLTSASWKAYAPASAKLTLLYLADCANPKNGNTCWPSVQTISRWTGLSERTVQTQISLLEKLGHITISRRWGRSSIYRLHPCDDFTPEEVAPANVESDEGEIFVIKPGKNCTQTIKNNKREPLPAGQNFLKFPRHMMQIYGPKKLTQKRSKKPD